LVGAEAHGVVQHVELAGERRVLGQVVVERSPELVGVSEQTLTERLHELPKLIVQRHGPRLSESSSGKRRIGEV
jgi:hypothetical protein